VEKIKVLFLTYPHIGLNRGGLQLQIERTAQELTKLGIDVVFYDPWKNQIKEVDLCHVFNICAPMQHHVQAAIQNGKCIIISPLFGCFESPSWLTAFKVKLCSIPGMFTELVHAKTMLKLSTKILPLSPDEQKVLIRAFHVAPEDCEIVPNGMEKKFINGDGRLFEEKFGMSDFVLSVGSINKNKNQLMLIKAMADLPYRLVIVGKAPAGNEDYMEKCLQAAGDNVIFTGWLSYEDPMLASAYAAAKVFVMPSYSETWGLCLYEAASSGCKVIASMNIPMSEEIRRYVPTFNPNKPRELAGLIDKQMCSGKNNEFQEIVRAMPTWGDVAKQIKQIYEEVLSKK